MKSLESSWAMTEGSVLQLLVFTVLAHMVSGMSSVFVFAAFIVVPLHYLVEANVYRQMTKGSGVRKV